jgi:predicted nucleic acid-binding protein
MSHELTTEEGREVFRRLQLLPLNSHPIEPLCELAFELALQTGRTVYDCVYLVLAKSQSWKFVTADERLANALVGSDLEPLVIWLGNLRSILPGLLASGSALPRPEQAP